MLMQQKILTSRSHWSAVFQQSNNWDQYLPDDCTIMVLLPAICELDVMWKHVALCPWDCFAQIVMANGFFSGWPMMCPMEQAILWVDLYTCRSRNLTTVGKMSWAFPDTIMHRFTSSKPRTSLNWIPSSIRFYSLGRKLLTETYC